MLKTNFHDLVDDSLIIMIKTGLQTFLFIRKINKSNCIIIIRSWKMVPSETHCLQVSHFNEQFYFAISSTTKCMKIDHQRILIKPSAK